MPTKKHVRPDEKIPLKLSAAERKLVLDGLTCLDQEIEQIVRDTPTGQPVKMTLDDLDDFGGYVAAEANHCTEDTPLFRTIRFPTRARSSEIWRIASRSYSRVASSSSSQGARFG